MPIQRPISRSLSFPLKRNVASYRGESGAVTFVDQDVRFDAANLDSMLRTAALTGATDSDEFTIVMRVELKSATPGSGYHIFYTNTVTPTTILQLNRSVANTMRVRAYNDTPSLNILFQTDSNSTWNASTGAKWVMISGTNGGTVKMYWGETDETNLATDDWTAGPTNGKIEFSEVAATGFGWTGAGEHADMEISAFYLYQTAYDPSVAANRRLFYAADGVTGHVPPAGALIQFGGTSTYSATDWNAGTNLGSGGTPYTVIGEMRNKPETYAHEVVNFDGATYFERGGSLTGGPAAANRMTMAFKFRVATGSSGTARRIIGSAGTIAGALVNASNNLAVTFGDAGETATFTKTGIAENTWYTVHVSTDATAGTPVPINMWVNGVAQTAQNWTLEDDHLLDYGTGATDWAIGSTTVATQLFNGDIGFIYFTAGTTAAYAVTDPAIFYNGGDVDLGVAGTLSGAPAPLVYFGGRQKAAARRGYAAKGWNDKFNQGTGGDFGGTAAGAVTDV